MNWQVAEAAAFHGGAGGCCEEDEAEAEAAAFAEYQRRFGGTQQAVHRDAAAVMAAEREGQRAREQRRHAERVQREQRENVDSVRLVGRQYGLPGEVSEGVILGHVGEPSGTRGFDYGRTAQALTETEHARREQARSGVAALDRRVDGYVNQALGGGGCPAEPGRWEELPSVSAQQAKEAIESNAATHALENKEFVQMFR